MAAAKFAGLGLAAALTAAAPAAAQAPLAAGPALDPAETGRLDPVAMAEKAAQDAERAAEAAADAARAARAAANALRAARASGALAEPAPEERAPREENLAVDNGPPAGAMRAFSDENLGAALQRGLDHNLASGVANGPNDAILKSATRPDVEFSVSDKDKTASVSMSFNLSGQTGDHLSTEQFTLTGSGKLDDSGDRSLVGLKGFANGADISLTYSRYSTRVTWGEAMANAERVGVDAARRKCLEAKWIGRGRKAPDDADEKKAREKDEKETCNPYKYATGVSKFVELYNPGELGALLDSVLPDDVSYWGLKLTGNQAAYKYLDRTAFGEKKDDHFGFSATVFGGELFSRGRTSLTGSFTYKRDFEAADPVTLCQAVASTTFTQCITSADGKPSREEQSIFAVEARHAVAKVGENFTLAIAPELSADVKNDAYSLVVPIYFASDDAGKLRAGVRAAFIDQKDKKNGGRDSDFSLGVFVGSAFGVFPY